MQQRTLAEQDVVGQSHKRSHSVMEEKDGKAAKKPRVDGQTN